MPIYEYMCRKCGAITEKIHGMNENPAVKCEACGGKAERKISGASFHLKGSGWYVTDYGKKSQMPEKGPSAPKGKKEGAPAAPQASRKPMPKLATDPD
jgi:putative FmdB family regulatory protein